MAIATTCQTAMWPLAVRPASVRAAAASTTWAPSMTARRLARSATAPPSRPRAVHGTWQEKARTPANVGVEDARERRIVARRDGTDEEPQIVIHPVQQRGGETCPRLGGCLGGARAM